MKFKELQTYGFSLPKWKLENVYVVERSSFKNTTLNKTSATCAIMSFARRCSTRKRETDLRATEGENKERDWENN